MRIVLDIDNLDYDLLKWALQQQSGQITDFLKEKNERLLVQVREEVAKNLLFEEVYHENLNSVRGIARKRS